MSDNEEEKKTDTNTNKQVEDIDLEDANNIDEKAFEEGNDLIDENVEKEFRCYNPQMKNGHIVYTCKGSDLQGSWEGERRFNEFYKLYEKLE